MEMGRNEVKFVVSSMKSSGSGDKHRFHTGVPRGPFPDVLGEPPLHLNTGMVFWGLVVVKWSFHVWLRGSCQREGLEGKEQSAGDQILGQLGRVGDNLPILIVRELPSPSRGCCTRP